MVTGEVCAPTNLVFFSWEKAKCSYRGKVTKMKATDVPVMAILKEFREMAGPRGRTAHRPAEKSTYEYEKHRFDPSKGASSSTM